MRYGRLSLRIAASVIFISSLILFLSGWVLQRQSVAILQKAINSDNSNKNAEKLRALNKIQLPQIEHDGFEEVGGRKKVAYVQQVDKLEAVCNSVMVFADLRQLESKAQRVLYYPAAWGIDLLKFRDEEEKVEDMAARMKKLIARGNSRPTKKSRKSKNNRRKPTKQQTQKAMVSKITEGLRQEGDVLPPFIRKNDKASVAMYETAKRLLIRAATQYGVKLVAVEDDPTSMSKMMSPLYLFNMTDYSRVIHLDPVSMVMKNLDHLLKLAPGIDVAATRAYWSQQESIGSLGSSGLSPNLFVVKPSEDEYRRILAHVSRPVSRMRKRGINPKPDVVSQVLNDLYQSTAMVLPQMPYELLTSEFRSKDSTHERYLGKPRAGKWNAVEALRSAYYVRFNDGEDGIDMPWKFKSNRAGEPQCASPAGNAPCADRDTWKEIYDMFAERRRNVCGLDLEPPDA